MGAQSVEELRKSAVKRMRCAGYVARMGGNERHIQNLKGGDHVEDEGINEKIILKWNSRKYDVWIQVSQNMAQLWAIMNTVMNLYVS
jgi:hypothetical protein